MTPRPAKASPRARGTGTRTPAVQGLAHVAIAVTDADLLARLLEAAFGARRGEEEWLDEGTLRVLFLHLGSLTLELLEPKPGHSVARFIERRGPGLHHLSLDVTDLDAALGRAVRAGIAAIDATPRTGAHGSRIAFLHPKLTGGVLIELKQRASEKARSGRGRGGASHRPAAKSAGPRRR